MGNKSSNSNSGERSLDQYMRNPQFRSDQQNIYTGAQANIPAYPGAGSYLTDEHTQAYAKKDIPITMQRALPVKNDFILDKYSIMLVPTKDPSVCYLTFRFSSLTEVEISIFYHGKDITDDEQNTQSIYVDTNKYPPVKSYIFDAVKDQHFPANASLVDTRIYKKDDLTKIIDGAYPLIIKMETKTNRPDVQKKILYTYFGFKLTGGKYEAKFLKQKFEVNHNTFILDDIYGIANSELSIEGNQELKDCTICLTNKIDTIVIPCKHMCICIECAKDLRDRNNQKCPMCRNVVENYLILKKS
jgi:hypothetical protein